MQVLILRTYIYVHAHTNIHSFMNYICYIQDIRYRHTYMHTCIHAYIHTYIHTYMHACMHACIHTYIHTLHTLHTYIHTSMHTCIHTYIHTSIHAYIHTDRQADRQTHVHTHMNTYAYPHAHVCLVQSHRAGLPRVHEACRRHPRTSRGGRPRQKGDAPDCARKHTQSKGFTYPCNDFSRLV